MLRLPSGTKVKYHIPNRANDTTVADGFRNLECLLDLFFRTGRDRLLNEHRDARQVLQDLHLNVASGLRRTAEHRGATDDNCMWTFSVSHPCDELFEGFVYACVLVRGDNEGLAFLAKHGLCTLDRGVDERNDLEARSQLATIVTSSLE